jgi:hypothetical protein
VLGKHKLWNHWFDNPQGTSKSKIIPQEEK